MRKKGDNEGAGPAASGRGRGEPGTRHPGSERQTGRGPAAARRGPPAGTPLPEGISRSLSKVLRPQAAYRWLLPQLAAISPRYIETTLRGALAGNHVQAWELFDLMEDTSPRLMKNLNEVKRAVVGLDWPLCPWQAENAAPSERALAKARLVGAALREMRPDRAADENDFSGTIYDVLDAWGKGQSVLEIDWEARAAGGLGQILAPRATYWVHPTCVSWDMEGRLGLRLEIVGGGGTPPSRGVGGGGTPPSWGVGGGGTPPSLTPGVWQTTSMQPRPGQVAGFPPHKFLISVCKAKSGTALGGALLRPLAWWWCAANFSGEWLMSLGEIFGVPVRWASYDPAAPQATIDGVCAALEKMGSRGWGAFPIGTTVDLIEPAGRGGDSPQGDLLDRAEKQMDLLILGQTLTTDVSKQGGSRALGEVHAGVKDEVVRAAGKFSAGVINTQLIPSILRLNYGESTEAPEFRPVAKGAEGARANAERDAALLAAGVRMPAAWFYQRHDVPQPQAGEATIGGAPRADAGLPRENERPPSETPGHSAAP